MITGIETFKTTARNQVNCIAVYIQGVKNNVYNASGMIEEVKTNMFFI